MSVLEMEAVVFSKGFMARGELRVARHSWRDAVFVFVFVDSTLIIQPRSSILQYSKDGSLLEANSMIFRWSHGGKRMG